MIPTEFLVMSSGIFGAVAIVMAALPGGMRTGLPWLASAERPRRPWLRR